VGPSFNSKGHEWWDCCVCGIRRSYSYARGIIRYVGLPRKLRTVVGTMLLVAMFCCLSARDSAFSGETAQSGGHMR